MKRQTRITREDWLVILQLIGAGLLLLIVIVMGIASLLIPDQIHCVATATGQTCWIEHWWQHLLGSAGGP